MTEGVFVVVLAAHHIFSILLETQYVVQQQLNSLSVPVV